MPGEGCVFLPVDAAYDRWAARYDSDDNPMVFGAARLVEALAAREARAAGTVVEFGCGTGRNLAALRRHGAARLVGCDLSEGMLAVARARDPGAQLLCQDMARPLPLADGAAGLALFCLTLEHVADPGPALAEARRLLRPGGLAVVIEIHPFLALSGVGAHFRDGAAEVRMPVVPHRFADHLNAFAAAGLAVERCAEWRPHDFGAAPPAKLLKRGAETPLLVEFRLRR